MDADGRVSKSYDEDDDTHDDEVNESGLRFDTDDTTTKRYTVQEQRAVIRQIHESNQILKQELAIELREAKTMMGAAKQEKLQRLQKQSTSYTQKIEVEKRTIVKLEAAIRRHHDELQRVRDEFVQSEKLESAAAAMRRLRALENRLEISLVKKNEVDSVNKHLRQQIDKVRRDRVVFDGIYKKLERETFEYKARLEAATSELARSVSGKVQIDKEVHELQALVDAEQQSYEKEFRELRLLIASSSHEAAELARAIELAPEAEIVSGQLSPDQELTLHHASALSSWKIAYDKAMASASSAEAVKYQQLFEHIFAETGVPDAERLTLEIQRKDEDNFKKFKHVEGLHKEVDDVRIELDRTVAALEAYKQQEGLGASVLDKTHLRALSAKLRSIDERNTQMDTEFDETCVRLGRIKASVHSIFTLLHQTTDKQKTPSHGSLTDITDANMLEYLETIEKCVIAQLTPAPAATHSAAKPKSKHAISPASLPVAETSSSSGARLLDEDERALTYDELREAAQDEFLLTAPS
ncbi:hypothetical protein SDRG_13693 [Saprolegnia diclina VS20]|uniref:ODAD1 central coiled coil region domain-containing protein n=1 Tax=Saprolegnia diclina (strain VS20) TaxID=1156394 RepID=T0PSY3_SAPDV|nr:hypothetical protein SDRG_13693 [Saprolegnia diclina VS20]EQC28614.1 hypothetical protein SDRG_13693 [Saprolegnia diclina VS20]|eukprot:XP_008618011.1 hypothetical protein SDRG_13693 [Saprolegnia diclina VS20]